MTGAKCGAILLTCTVESLFLTMIALYIIENVKKSHPRNYVADSLIVYMRVLVYLV